MPSTILSGKDIFSHVSLYTRICIYIHILKYTHYLYLLNDVERSLLYHHTSLSKQDFFMSCRNCQSFFFYHRDKQCILIQKLNIFNHLVCFDQFVNLTTAGLLLSSVINRYLKLLVFPAWLVDVNSC
jgi:hypothetical protein